VRLITLHRILVSTAIAFCAWFVWSEVGSWRRDSDRVALAGAIVAAVVAVLLTWYLTNLKRFVHVEPPERREP
jgi:hypothetical protein